MNKQQQYRATPKLVTVSINGLPVKIDPASISKDRRVVLHGDYKGVQVNSPALTLIGDSAVFWPDSTKSFAVTMAKADLGMLATKFLQGEGFAITPTAPR
jgi:hypothetical protein